MSRLFAVSTMLAATVLLSSWQASAQSNDYEISDQSDGGVIVSFPSRCRIAYDAQGYRGGHSGSCNQYEYRTADQAASSYLRGGSSQMSVSVNQMARYCQGEASAELNVRPTDLSTRAAERMGSRYVVAGQTNGRGSNVTRFECTFDRDGVFEQVRVTSSPGSSNSQSGGVPQAQMGRYCMGEASAELNVRPTYIKVEPVHRENGQFIVNGRSQVRGYDATDFRCVFSNNGRFEGVVVTRGGNGQNNQPATRPSQGTIPTAARARCLNMFGGGASTSVRQVSALRPGFWEVIMDSPNRSVACTVTDSGEIENWVELN